MMAASTAPCSIGGDRSRAEADADDADRSSDRRRSSSAMYFRKKSVDEPARRTPTFLSGKILDRLDGAGVLRPDTTSAKPG